MSSMFKSYFTVGWRNLLKSKTHSFINIGGLAAGIASCLLIGLYIADELSYDRYHVQADRVHRVVATDWAKMPPAVAPALKASYPHLLDEVVRLWPVFAPAKLRHDDVVFVESGVVFADPGVFKVFTWPLIAGNADKALTSRNSIVLTQSAATKYFGERNPVGEQMKFWGNELTITGVITDIPQHSHLNFDFLISLSTLESVMGNGLDEKWDMPVFFTYLLTNEGASITQLEDAVTTLLKENFSDPSVKTTLQPLTDIHLHSHLQGEFKAGGNVSYLYILGTAAVFILVLAGVNFTNLNTARATTRAREVGMRKTLGAMKRQLIEQFFGESLITCLLAWFIAITVVSVILPSFNQFSGKSIHADQILTAKFLGTSLLIVVFISLCAGSYPALFLSRLKAVSSLKGSGMRASNPILRKGLIVFQFMISTFFLAGMIVILLQLDFLRSKDLGFDKEHVIVLDGDGFPLLKKELAGVAGVEHVSGVPQVLPARLPSTTYRASGITNDSTSRMAYYGVTPDFIETMSIRLIAGKSFTEGSLKDEQEAFVLNESATAALGWTPDEAIGKSFSMFVPPLNGGAEQWRDGIITGVVRDFNHDVLYKSVSPVVLYPSYDMNLTLLRLTPHPDVIGAVQKAWGKVNPHAPFNYYFLDDRIQQHYESEIKLGTLVSAATILAIIIACLGLSGLVSFTANQRTKEIGIRKVMGASSRQVIALLSRDFIKLVAIAAIVSLPIAYYALNQWVANFAYHINLSWTIFTTTGLCTLFVAMVTVVLQSLKVALAQPTEALRSD